jgi:uncharacterized protein YjbI with pentapeptide repeats
MRWKSKTTRLTKWLNPKRLIEKIWEDDFKISLFVLVVAFLLVNLPTILSGRYLQKDFLESMLANANSMILDILVILCLTTFLIKKSEKRREIQRLKDEIDDFRGWNSEEAAHRIRGIIFRLNKFGVTKVNLSCCFLNKTDLSQANLSQAKFGQANLIGANLSQTILFSADLRLASLHGADLGGADLSQADLSQADLSQADFSGAILIGARLCEADLSRAKLSQADLSQANLGGANLSEAILVKAALRQADLGQYDPRAVVFHDFPIFDDFGEHANFTRANLTRANFIQADLHGVKNILKALGIESADFTDAIMDDETREFLSKINPTVKPVEKLPKESCATD